MNLLILGGGGMLGHKVWQLARSGFRTRATVRSAGPARRLGFPPEEILGGVDAADFDSVIRAVGLARPDVVVNCIGIIKQLPTAKDPVVSIGINSLFPHRLHALCRAAGARLIHVSTDCVFSGRKGRYVETDPPDADDLYGRSKLLGEVDGEGAVTLRTSIIGRELSGSSGLVEWFLANRGKKVDGYSRAIFSGLTSAELARTILSVAVSHAGLEGLYHVSVDPISKYDLLHLLNAEYDAGVTIVENDRVLIDRSLDSTRFREATGFRSRPWPELIREMAADSTPYDQWRTS
jgi:dTDP-4-dehydrorhamnose reductase